MSPMDMVLIYPYWNVNQIQATVLSLHNRVLIYPYWNVNPPCTAVLSVVASFNLSILECKCINHYTLGGCCRVLIYPYWNVNNHWFKTDWIDKCVLIYPYWNANDTIPETFTKRVFDTQWGWMVYYFYTLTIKTELAFYELI